MSDQKAILNEMVKMIGDNADKLNLEETLTLFTAKKGRHSTGELMVVGRAVNGGINNSEL